MPVENRHRVGEFRLFGERLVAVETHLRRDRVFVGEPFAQQRNRLAWPLRGKLAVAYGASDDSGRSISGIVVAAASGSEVRAISHGRRPIRAIAQPAKGCRAM